MNRAFALGVALNLGFVAVEAGYGLAANALALLADALHNLGDVAGLLIAWGASWLARRPATQRFTYGYRRASLLAALANVCLLMVAVGGIAWEAVRRLDAPQPVDSAVMMIVAGLGILINGATAMLFASGSKHDLNLKGAFIHMLADAAVSAGVVLAGLLILLTGRQWLDPLMSLIVSIVIVAGSWGLMRESLRLSLDGVPDQIDSAQVERFLRARDGVKDVHDLHIWALGSSEVALTAHLVLPETVPAGFIAETVHALEHEFGICHATLQLESAACEHRCHRVA